MDIFYKNYKNTIFLSLIIAVVLAVLLALISINFKLNRAYIGEAMLYLVFENDNRGRMFRGEVVDGMTILEALHASSQAGNISFNYFIDSDGRVVIKSIDGYSADSSKKSLVFYLNHSRIKPENIHSVVIKPGDLIKVALE